jgi:flavin reductase (DIM6/NTAB) family NADH-FMN oxidoreductase RutF
MEVDTEDLSLQQTYLRMVQLITPRPIAWVSTVSAAGVPNLAPFSFFTGVGANPPTICFAPANDPSGAPKHTLENIRHNGQFVVNLVTEPLAQAMHRTADPVAAEINEFELAGVAPAPSTKVTPPRVAACVAAMECSLHSAIALGTGPGGANLVIGNVLHFNVNDELVDEKVLHTVARVGRREYTEVKTTFRLQ